MTKSRSLCTAASFAALFAAAVARPLRGETPADAAAVLERQTQEMFDAISAGNAAVWDRYLDPDVKYTDENGAVMTKKGLVDGTKPLPTGVSGTIRVTDFRAAFHGDVAVTTHVEDENESYHGHALHCQYRTTDTWVKTPAGCRLIAGQVLALRTLPPCRLPTRSAPNTSARTLSLPGSTTRSARKETVSRVARPGGPGRRFAQKLRTSSSFRESRGTGRSSGAIQRGRSRASRRDGKPGTSTGRNGDTPSGYQPGAKAYNDDCQRSEKEPGDRPLLPGSARRQRRPG